MIKILKEKDGKFSKILLINLLFVLTIFSLFYIINAEEVEGGTTFQIIQTSSPTLKIVSGADANYKPSIDGNKICFTPNIQDKLPNTIEVTTDKGILILNKSVSVSSKEEYCYNWFDEKFLRYNPAIVNQSESMVQFIDDDLIVNNTLRKWNGEEFIIAPEDIWIKEPHGDNYKFGANDTVAINDTLYQYEWISNKEIRYDEDEERYYFKKTFTNEDLNYQYFNITWLNTWDICNNETNCSFELNNYYKKADGDRDVLNYSQLLVNFKGIYNSSLGMVFLDPTYTVGLLNISNYFQDGFNRTYKPVEITAGVNRTNLTASYNSSAMNGTVYYVNLTDKQKPSDSYKQKDGGLVFAYHLDNWASYGESTSLVYDYSGHNYNGTAIGITVNTTDCIYGNCFKLDSTDSITTTYDPDTYATNTVALWLESNNPHSEDIIFSSSGGLDTFAMIDYFGSSKFEFYGPGFDILSQTTITAGKWYHLVFVWSTSGDYARIYVNGKLEISDTDISSQSQSTIKFGAPYPGDTFGGDGQWDGNMDEILLFNRSLTDKEIKELYVTGSLNHSNNGAGVGINWTGSSTGKQELTTYNATHDWATNYTIPEDTDNLLAELQSNEKNASITSVIFDTYLYEGGAPPPIEDTTPPNVTINTPLNQSYTINSITFNVTALDDFHMDNCSYKLNDITNFTMANASTSVNDYIATNSTMAQGSHTATFLCYDNSSNLNNSETQEFYIDSINPDFVDIYNVTIYQNQSVDEDFNATDNLVFDDWSVNNTAQFSIDSTGNLKNTTALLSKRYYLNLTINDSLNNINSTIIYVNVSDIVVDAEYPIFSNSVQNPANNSEYVEGATYEFNITITSTNGTAGTEINGIANYSLSNIGDIFNRTFVDISAGTYTSHYWAYGNGTDAHFNKSIDYSYTLAKNSSLVLGITGTTPLTYPTATDVAGSNCPSQLSCALDKSNRVYGVGESPLTFNYSTSGNNNYTSSSKTIAITINQNTSARLFTYLNNSRENITIEKNKGIWLNASLFNVSGTIELYVNGTRINSGTDNIANFTDFNVNGIYNISGIFIGNENYSGYSEEWFVNVSGGDTCTYTSGDWVVNCSDNCEITSDVAVDSGSSMILSGVGTFTVLANITTELLAVEPTCQLINKPNDGNWLAIYGG